MKKLLLGLSLLSTSLVNAQVVKTLTKTIELAMPKIVIQSSTGADSMAGKRGGAVVWHPLQKKYYASFAGNATFPLSVFSPAGKRLSADDQTCLEDLRGLWYNPKLKKICGNGYSDIGWFSYKLDEKGFPIESEIIAAGQNQPGLQSIGTFNPSSNMVYFLNGQKIFVYNENAMQEEDSTVRLYVGITKTEDIKSDDDATVLSSDYSYNVLLYTGIPKAEFGLLNAVERKVELYNRKTGLLTMKLLLPPDLPTWGAFNFSYANGIYWAFDQDTRIWTGYK